MHQAQHTENHWLTNAELEQENLMATFKQARMIKKEWQSAMLDSCWVNPQDALIKCSLHESSLKCLNFFPKHHSKKKTKTNKTEQKKKTQPKEKTQKKTKPPKKHQPTNQSTNQPKKLKRKAEEKY